MVRIHFSFIFNSSLPFDENTPIGWTTVFGLHLIFASTYTASIIPASAFFLAIGLYFKACTHHFQNIFVDMNKISNQNPSIQVGLNIKKKLIEAINFHNAAKRYNEVICSSQNQ